MLSTHLRSQHGDGEPLCLRATEIQTEFGACLLSLNIYQGTDKLALNVIAKQFI